MKHFARAGCFFYGENSGERSAFCGAFQHGFFCRNAVSLCVVGLDGCVPFSVSIFPIFGGRSGVPKFRSFRRKRENQRRSDTILFSPIYYYYTLKGLDCPIMYVCPCTRKFLSATARGFSVFSTSARWSVEHGTSETLPEKWQRKAEHRRQTPYLCGLAAFRQTGTFCICRNILLEFIGTALCESGAPFVCP